ncbi:MAG: pantoate--beta-alanine ligase [Acidobacteriota bacterium]
MSVASPVRIDRLPALADVAEVRAFTRRLRRDDTPLALVPTMGALHAGHRSLIEAARRHGGAVLVSIFVNPTQFGPGDDLERYPRRLAQDMDICREAGASAVFAPDAATFYAPDHSTWVSEDRLSLPLEGAVRPGHFRGVLTVVLKLLAATDPDIVVFGQKDAQQAILIRRMARDLNLRTAVLIAPTVRDADGLALSSRNAYLTAGQRRQALALPRALEQCTERLRRGETSPATIRDAGHQILAAEPALAIDYLEVVDLDTLEVPVRVEEPVLIAAAVRIGDVRLIDNEVWPGGALVQAGGMRGSS